MSRIVHLALRVDDLERTTQFYTEVFGFAEMNTDKVRDHTSPPPVLRHACTQHVDRPGDLPPRDRRQLRQW